MNKEKMQKVMRKLVQMLRRCFSVNETPTKNEVKTSSKRQTSGSLATGLEEFLKERYDFRFNVLTEQAEVCRKGEAVYRPVNQRMANTLCLEAQDNGVYCWDRDVLRLLNSERMADFHPFLNYMAELPSWDGIDRVTSLAQRISEDSFWVEGFHKWLLGMAAQWSGRMEQCANAVVPLLVSSRQGMCKSTFCKLLIPNSLREYYTDSYDLNAQSSCEQKLALCGLINLDESRRYWFTAEEETELMKRNRSFYAFPVNHDVFFRNYRLPQEGEAAELVAPGELFDELVKAYPLEMRGMNTQRFGRMLTAIGAERVHTVKGNMYRIVRAA